MTFEPVGPLLGGVDARPLAVLLVEDDEGDAFLVQELLADTPSIRFRRAHSVAEARDRLDGIDCVLLDLGLPDAVGLDGLLQIRSVAGRTPVVVLTGFADETRGTAAVTAGAQDYLVKGYVTAHTLSRTIRYAIQRRHVEDIESALLEERIRAQENARLERGLLPTPLLYTDDLTVTTRYRPGSDRLLLGGDFFDVVQDADGTVHAVIGDVAGHGPDEAAVGVALRIAWRTMILAGRPPEEIMAVVDRVLVHERHDGEVLATACMVSVAPDRATAIAYTGGHPPPMLHAPGSHGKPGHWWAAPVNTGPALGLIDRATFPPTRLALEPGWGLLLYTDGAIEGHAGADRLGVDGLVRVLSDPATNNDLDQLVATITRLNEGPLTDDLALLLVAADPDRNQPG